MPRPFEVFPVSFNRSLDAVGRPEPEAVVAGHWHFRTRPEPGFTTTPEHMDVRRFPGLALVRMEQAAQAIDAQDKGHM